MLHLNKALSGYIISLHTYSFLQQLCIAGQGLNAALQDTVHIGNGNAIVRHRYILVDGAFIAVDDFSFIEHTGTTVDNELIGGQVLRKLCATGPGEARLCLGVGPYPGRELISANVATLAVMCAALAYKHLIAILKLIEHGDTFDSVI